jgi:adenosylcobinamide-GDP ribazoletransferase
MRKLMAWLIDQYAELVAAVRFLSILPLPSIPQLSADEQSAHTPRGMVLGSGYFSLVGLLLGLLLSLLQLLLNPLLPRLALAAVLVVALVLLTGGLHLDGLMDTCDGLLGGRTRERRLEIMRDSRVGSFGVLGGVCVLLLKFAFIASLQVHALYVALLCVLPVARWAMVLALRSFPSARPGGLGVTFRRSVTLPRLCLAGGSALGIALLAGHLVGVFLWLAATVTAFALGRWFTRSIGGLTGDTYGAIAEITEVVTVLLLVFLRSWL